MSRGKLIIVEGPDGLGKSTLTEQLLREFESLGQPAKMFSFPGRDDGTLGRLVYRLHHEPQSLGVSSCSELSRQLLHVAAHIDLIESRILPTLSSGASVVLDRFWWSTLVYGLANEADETALRRMLDVEFCVWGNVTPDLAVLLQRSEPFVPRPEMKIWSKLSVGYSRLAQVESEKYPVEILNLNDRSDNLCPTILGRLSETK